MANRIVLIGTQLPSGRAQHRQVDWAPGDTLIVPDGRALAFAGGGGGSINVFNYTLTGTDITNKHHDFGVVPADVNSAMLIIGGAPGQCSPADFVLTITGRLSWSGKALDGVLQSGDSIMLLYL